MADRRASDSGNNCMDTCGRPLRAAPPPSRRGPRWRPRWWRRGGGSCPPGGSRAPSHPRDRGGIGRMNAVGWSSLRHATRRPPTCARGWHRSAAPSEASIRAESGEKARLYSPAPRACCATPPGPRRGARDREVLVRSADRRSPARLLGLRAPPPVAASVVHTGRGSPATRPTHPRRTPAEASATLCRRRSVRPSEWFRLTCLRFATAAVALHELQRRAGGLVRLR